MAELVQASLEASCSANGLSVSPLDIVDIVEVENGERVLGSLLAREGRRRGRLLDVSKQRKGVLG